VALLPGSRAAELERLGGHFAAAASLIAERFPDVAFLGPVAPGVSPERVAASLSEGPPVALVQHGRHEVLAHCVAAVAASGTASLELALLGVPHVVAYQVSPVTWRAARLLVHVEHVALPNLIAGRTVVPEFLQRMVEAEAIADPVLTWLEDEAARADVVRELAAVRMAVGPSGVADRAARAALDALGLAL
jgi:lipid-A-disaccharide synthase